jgi:hypothetical protein
MKIDVPGWIGLFSVFSSKRKSGKAFSYKKGMTATKQRLTCHPPAGGRGICGLCFKRLASESIRLHSLPPARFTDPSCVRMTKEKRYSSRLSKTFLFVCFFFFAVSLHAQVVNLSFDKQRILLGEQIGVKVKAFADKGATIANFPVDTLPHLEILQSSKVDTTIVGNTVQLSQSLIVTSWDSGRWNIPTAILAGTPSKPIAIDVVYTSPWNPNQPYHDIKGIVPARNPGRSTWWWYLIGLAVLVALFLLFFPESKRDKDKVELDKTAYKKAMQQLDKLEKEKAVDAKQFYTELINIFRGYLKGAKGIQSFSKTTDDLSIQLQSQKLPSAQYNGLVQSLRLSDLVKFAAYKPDEAMKKETLNTIKQSITTLEQANAI